MGLSRGAFRRTVKYGNWHDGKRSEGDGLSRGPFDGLSDMQNGTREGKLKERKGKRKERKGKERKGNCHLWDCQIHTYLNWYEVKGRDG